MPKMYEAIRDKFVADGMPLKKAKTAAAKIYNSKRKTNKKLPKLTHKPDK